jgi:hypothetical protein
MTTRLYLAKSVNVLNGLFMLAVAAAAYYIIVPLLNTKIQATLPVIGKAETAMAAQPAALPNPSLSDYALVAEQNLFHPERKIPEEKKAVSASIAPKPDLVLYGTLIADDVSIAYVEDRKTSYTTPGRGVRQQQLKKGDSISGYILREVETNRIVLVKGEERIAVMLDEKGRKRGGEPTTPAATASVPGSPPPSPPWPAVFQPAPLSATAASPAPSAPPVSVQPPVQSGAASTAPVVHTYDPRKIRLQNK